MIIVADSGSTKTDWRILSGTGSTKQILTAGINPQYLSTDQIFAILKEGLLPQLDQEVPILVDYYGAGCSSVERSTIVKVALEKAFPGSEIHVNHDLLAAARALCGHESGIACILGTGSNSCLYDGKNVVDNVPSLGFLMGDEGSGAYLGKMLIRAYLYRELPEEVALLLKNKYKLTKDGILDTVYYAAMPSTYLATFAKFMLENKEHPVIHAMIYRNFDDFFRHHVSKYTGYAALPVSFVGSIAFYFKDILQEVATKYNTRLGKILKSPTEGLIDYQLNAKAAITSC